MAGSAQPQCVCKSDSAGKNKLIVPLLCYTMDNTLVLFVIQHHTQARAYWAKHSAKYFDEKFCSFQKK